MGSLISRYFAREVFQALLAVTLVLLLIFISHRVVVYLAEAASGDLPDSVIWTLVGLTVAKYLILLLPLALYLAILLVLNRLYRDNEMVALAACGVSTVRLYRPMLMVALPLVVVTTWLSLYGAPWAARLEARVTQQARYDVEVTGLTPGRFHEGGEGARILYAEEVTEGGSRMANVFVHVRGRQADALLSARRARLESDPETHVRYLVLVDGTRYDGAAGRADYRIARFERHGVMLRSPPPSQVGRQEAKATAELWGSGNSDDVAELQRRLSIPFTVVLLGFLAVPISRTRPRRGRYGRMFLAVVVYVVYVNLLALAEKWTEQGVLPLWLGVWWVHGLLALLAAGLLAHERGFLQRWLRGARA